MKRKPCLPFASWIPVDVDMHCRMALAMQLRQVRVMCMSKLPTSIISPRASYIDIACILAQETHKAAIFAQKTHRATNFLLTLDYQPC